MSEFERESKISNGYLNNTLERGAEISKKMLDKVKENSPDMYDIVKRALGMSEETMQVDDFKEKYYTVLEKRNGELEKRILDLEASSSGKGVAEDVAAIRVAYQAVLNELAKVQDELRKLRADIFAYQKTGK